MLTVESLGKKFNSKWIIKNISFKLKQGDILIVQGPNGSGKSTLLKILAGLMLPTQGKFIAEKSIGYAALDLNLYSALNAKEHLNLAAQLQNKSKEKINVQEFLEKVGIHEDQNKLIEHFSTGMRSRLKIALALLKEPSILILDEPTASLDQQGKLTIEQLIVDQKKKGVTILATNNMDELKYATHLINFNV